MRRAVFVLVVLALAFVAGPACAQSSSAQLYGFGGAPGTVVSTTQVPGVIRGEMVVSFRGDVAAGCAVYGVCSYAGTVMVRPVSVSLAVVTSRFKGRIAHQAMLLWNGLGNGLTTSARVQRTVPGGRGGTCADAQSSVFGSESGAISHGRSITIGVLSRGGSVLQTRCAGPLDGDLASVSPTATMPLARALHGRTTIDLSGTRTFAVHGFVGTLTSTLVMRLGRPQPASSPSGPSFPPGVRVQRIRTVIEQLSLVRVNGHLAAAVQGTGDPIVCRLLDTCGLSGTLTLGRIGKGANAQVVATGPASRPYGDFLAALDLTRGGHALGIDVGLFVSLPAGVRADISQGGGSCRDTSEAGGLAVAVGSFFGGSGGGGGFFGSWRTRCPGPVLGTGPVGVRTSLAPGALGHRQFAVTLRGSGSFSDDGYVISRRGRLSVVVRRGRITQQVATQPVP